MLFIYSQVVINTRRVWVMVECRGSRVIGRGSRVIGLGSKVEVEGHRSRVEGHKSRVEGHRSRVESRGRGSKVEVEGQKSRSRVKSRGRGSKVENTKFLSILKVLQPLNAAKQLVLLSKLKNFAYAVWLCTV